MYKNISEKPERGQLCLCKCPEWCASGLQVAEWDGKEFTYEEVPNEMFNELVTEYVPLTDDGELDL